jgi:myo-inositol-1(or 4)-monophosphatase
VNDRRLRVAVRQNLADCVIATGMPFKGRGGDGRYLEELAGIMPNVAGIRRFGAAALDLAWVAAGRFDGFWERGLQPWDLAAGILIIREAGGFATDLQGGDAVLETGAVVAGNESVHGQLLEALRR